MKKAKLDFSEAIVAYDIKVNLCHQLNKFLRNMKGQGHLLT